MSRKALLIGINYRGTSSELQGCLNDVKNMTTFLVKNGYSHNDITIITDDTKVKPTRLNIINALMELLNSNADNLFFHYSGHGSWIPDNNNDEPDKRDECLVPLDYEKAGVITDDQLSGLFTFMNPNSKMIAILDCCHSGTALDLCYTLCNDKNNYIMKKQDKYKDTPGQIIMISGCLDNQTSADAVIARQAQGALTASLLECFKNPNLSIKQLVVNVRQKLQARKFTQIANLTSGKPLSLDEKFTI